MIERALAGSGRAPRQRKALIAKRIEHSIRALRRLHLSNPFFLFVVEHHGPACTEFRMLARRSGPEHFGAPQLRQMEKRRAHRAAEAMNEDALAARYPGAVLQHAVGSHPVRMSAVACRSPHPPEPARQTSLGRSSALPALHRW